MKVRDITKLSSWEHVQGSRLLLVIRTQLQCSHDDENIKSQAPPTEQHNNTEKLSK